MIPRHLLPQIPSDQYEAFAEFLRGQGIDVRLKRVPISSLKPIQSHIKRDKVDSLKKDAKALAQPLIVSKGLFILDGHHRYVAQKEEEPDSQKLVFWCDCSIKELFEKAHLFEGSFVKTIHERAMYYR